MADVTQPPGSPISAGPSASAAQQFLVPDPAMLIAAQDQRLTEYLNRPVLEILAQLGHPPLPAPPPMPGADPPTAPASPLDPGALIKPVTDALGTLGTGLFEAVDPSQMFTGIASAIEAANTAVTPAVSRLPDTWEGAGATAATTKTATALQDGHKLATQAVEIRDSLTSATAAVKQAEVRLLEIIDRFVATVTAIGPNIIFPWGQAALLAAATEAVTRAAETMTELQATLSDEAATVTAAGSPVAVTEAPQAGTDVFGQVLGALTKGAQSGVQTATDLTSGLSESAAGLGPAATPLGPTGTAAPSPKTAGTGSSGGGGGGGAGGFTTSLSTRSAQLPAVSEETGRATPAAAARGSGPAGAMYPPGMMGAPMAAGAHGGRPNGDSHSAASFLHTTENGQAIVGDLGTAAPAVLGETESPRTVKRATHQQTDTT